MKIFLFLTFIFSGHNVLSQTWGLGDEPEIGDQGFRYLVDTTANNYASLTGDNQTWDYSQLAGYPNNLRPLALTDGSNYQAVYPGVTHVLEIPGFMTMIYEYNAGDQKMSRGFELNIPDFGLVNAVFDDHQTMLNLPFSFGDNWQDTFEGSLILLGESNPLVGEGWVEIDGSGELLLANGVTHTEVLRIHSVDTMYAEVTLDGLPFPTNIMIVRNQYDYVKSSVSPFPLFSHASLEILNPLLGAIETNMVLSSENPSPVIAIEDHASEDPNIFPNPAQEILNVLLPNQWSYADLVLCDLFGKEILKISTENLQETINISNLESGLYLLIVKNESTEKTFRFLVKD